MTSGVRFSNFRPNNPPSPKGGDTEGLGFYPIVRVSGVVVPHTSLSPSEEFRTVSPRLPRIVEKWDGGHSSVRTLLLVIPFGPPTRL